MKAFRPADERLAAVAVLQSVFKAVSHTSREIVVGNEVDTRWSLLRLADLAPGAIEEKRFLLGLYAHEVTRGCVGGGWHDKLLERKVDSVLLMQLNGLRLVWSKFGLRAIWISFTSRE